MTPHWLWLQLKRLCLPNLPDSTLIEAVSAACVAGDPGKAFERIEYFTAPYNAAHVKQVLALASRGAPALSGMK